MVKQHENALASAFSFGFTSQKVSVTNYGSWLLVNINSKFVKKLLLTFGDSLQLASVSSKKPPVKLDKGSSRVDLPRINKPWILR